ncbi:hypothetical protein HGG76_10380 [Ochrobactrum tritici]|uniref:Uncharacterized protein n=1 Tax=Brucella tritici TaxID=94626 RepID=A0A7X6JCT0_9HYPH|nr:hypothetical protein [Brucella tritici]
MHPVIGFQVASVHSILVLSAISMHLADINEMGRAIWLNCKSEGLVIAPPININAVAARFERAIDAVTDLYNLCERAAQ